MSNHYTQMYEVAEDAGQLWDEVGVSAMQPVLDELYSREPDRQLTGSRKDWADLARIAAEMDAR